MPKKLKISPNQRVDLLDFNRSSYDYTQDSEKLDRSRLLQSGKPLVSHGFRVEVAADQVANAGQFTVHNGTAIDRDGDMLTNEQQVNDARTASVTGISTTFYVEVEFVESLADVDSRAFWDPTYSGNTPKGREYNINVATRINSDWRIVNPIDTTGFDLDTDPNSTKIPVAILTTDGFGGIIDVGWVKAATVLAEDVAQFATSIPVLDSSLFPSTGTITIGAESGIPLTSNDLANNVLIIGGGGVASAKSLGAIVVNSGASAFTFLPESIEPVPTTGSDYRRGLFKGDELHGTALSSSKETAGARDDNDIRSLKDHVDFLSAQIRELKFGNLRPDVNSSTPPFDFSSTRYYDAAGGVAGARTATITIGDGTVSYGDLNSSSDDLGTIIQEAVNALDPTAGGSIFIKTGNYVFDATVSTDRPLTVIFDEGATFVAGTYPTTLFDTTTVDHLKIVGAPDVPTASWPYELVALFSVPSAVVTLERCYTGTILATAADTTLYIDRCILTATNTTAAIQLPSPGAPVASLVCKNSTFRYYGAQSTSASIVSGNLSFCTFENCVFDSAFNIAGGSGFYLSNSNSTNLLNLKVIGCTFTSTQTSEMRTSCYISGSSVRGVLFRDCIFDHSWSPTAGTALQRTVLWFESSFDLSSITVDNCDFSPMGANGIGNTSAGAPGRMVSFSVNGAATALSVVNNTFGKNIDTTVTSTVPVDFVDQVYVHLQEGSVSISNNSFSTFTTGVRVTEGSAIIDSNSFTLRYPAVALTDAVKGVFADTSLSQAAVDKVIISNNYFHLDVQTTGNVHAIHVLPKDDGTLSVTGNDITILNTASTPSVSDQYAIHLQGQVEGIGTQRNSVVGNNIRVQGPGATGISFVYEDNVRHLSEISSNVVLIRTTGTAGGEGISLLSLNLLTLPSVIANNTISMSAVAAGGAALGITQVGNAVIVQGNSITQTDSQTQRGISFQGDNLVISDNMIRQDDGAAVSLFCSTSDVVSVSGNLTEGSWSVSTTTNLHWYGNLGLGASEAFTATKTGVNVI